MSVLSECSLFVLGRIGCKCIWPYFLGNLTIFLGNIFEDGHETHTEFTAVGSEVIRASLLGYANTTARGMAPKARNAAYKVCWAGGCFSTDILKAIDKAATDGVNVLSMSLGGGIAPYYTDNISLGVFGAMHVSCSTGNSGSDAVSLSNVAPWRGALCWVAMGKICMDIGSSGGVIFGQIPLAHDFPFSGQLISPLAGFRLPFGTDCWPYELDLFVFVLPKEDSSIVLNMDATARMMGFDRPPAVNTLSNDVPFCSDLFLVDALCIADWYADLDHVRLSCSHVDGGDVEQFDAVGPLCTDGKFVFDGGGSEDR